MDALSGGRRGTDHQKPAEHVAAWMKIAGSIIGFAIVIVGVTLYVSGFEVRITVLETKAGQQEYANEQNDRAIEQILGVLTDIKIDIGKIKGKLGIQ